MFMFSYFAYVEMLCKNVVHEELRWRKLDNNAPLTPRDIYTYMYVYMYIL